MQNFGLLDLVKKVLASHKCQMDRSREQYARDLAGALGRGLPVGCAPTRPSLLAARWDSCSEGALGAESGLGEGQGSSALSHREAGKL